MATKPKRVCGWPGCPALVDKGYCPAHQQEKNRRDYLRRNARRSTTVRDAVARRDGGQCVVCGSTDRVQRHHVRPLSEGGIDHPSNMVTLCKFHHDQAHARRA